MSCAENSISGGVWRFETDRDNTGEMTVSDPLLNTYERAEERGLSELLNNAYIPVTFSFKTYRSDVEINEEISLFGVPYMVTNITAAVSDRSIVYTITVKRWE